MDPNEELVELQRQQLAVQHQQLARQQQNDKDRAWWILILLAIFAPAAVAAVVPVGIIWLYVRLWKRFPIAALVLTVIAGLAIWGGVDAARSGSSGASAPTASTTASTLGSDQATSVPTPTTVQLPPCTADDPNPCTLPAVCSGTPGGRLFTIPEANICDKSPYGVPSPATTTPTPATSPPPWAIAGRPTCTVTGAGCGQPDSTYPSPAQCLAQVQQLHLSPSTYAQICNEMPASNS